MVRSCAHPGRWLPVLMLVIGAQLGVATVGLFADEPFGGRNLGLPGRGATEVRRLPPADAKGDHNCRGTGDAFSSFNGFHVATSHGNPDSNTYPVSQPETHLYLGYDRGFVLAADQAKGDSAESFDFLMRVNSWFQLRHTLFDSDGPNPDQNTFSFERLRLAFKGHVYSKDVGYFFQFDGNSDRSTNVILLDYFTSYDVGHNLFCWEKKKLGVKLGKWKVPFSRSREESGRQLQFTDRAIANVFFDLNRSLGLGLYGQLDHYGAPIHFETAVFNGFQTGSVSTNRANGELDRNFGWSARSSIDLIGDFGDDGEPDLSWHTTPALRLGGGLAYTRIDQQGTSEFSRQSVVDSGATLASILPSGVSAYDVWLYTVDAHLKYHGLSIIAEYYWRYIAQIKGGTVPNLIDDGLVVQTGYFIVPERLEILFRWSRLAGDSGTLGLVDQSSDAVAGGFAWYIKGQNAKLVFDATHHNGAPIGVQRIDTLASDNGWLFRTQFQLAF